MTRRFLLVLAVVAALLAGSAVPAAAEDREHEGEHGTLLGLGDSVAFGFNPLLDAAQASHPGNFVGYPELAARRLELHVVNASCPGEATGGFLSPTGTDNGCRPYRAALPLHVRYSGTQLAFAVSYLRAHHNVRLVTIDIGANDVFVLQRQCNNVPACVNAGLPQVLATIQANLAIAFGQIRGQAHYRGTLVAVTYYALAYDPATAAGTQALNAPIAATARQFGGVIADGFAAFQGPAVAAGGTSCAAGLLIVLAPGRCDVHPTRKGQDLLARAVARAAIGGGDPD
jgi:lysophospholipase L1-like esterase